MTRDAFGLIHPDLHRTDEAIARLLAARARALAGHPGSRQFLAVAGERASDGIPFSLAGAR